MLAISATALGVLLLLLALAVALIVGTETGTRLALHSAAPLLPDGVRLGESRGRLLDRLILRDLRVETETLVIDVAEVRVHWAPLPLLRRHLEIRALTASGVRYRPLPHTPREPEEPFVLPERVDLPISVSVRHLEAVDVEIHTAPDQDDPLILERLALAGRFRDARLDLARFEAEGPALAARGAGSLLAAGEYPLAASADWHFAIDGYAPLVGASRLDGSLRSLQFQQRVAPPYGIDAHGTLDDLLAAGLRPTVAAEVRVDGLALAAVAERLPDATVSFAGRIAGPLDDLEVQASASGVDPEQRRFEAAVAARVAQRAVQLRELTVTQPGRPGRLHGEGRVALENGLAADLEVAWDQLQWPLAGDPTLTSPHGRLRVVGPPDGYHLEMVTRLEPLDQPPVELRVQGAGSREAVTLDLDALVADGRVEGRVALDWSGDVRVTAELAGRGIDPAVLLAEWPGAVDVSLVATAALADGRLAIRLSRLEVGGRLRGELLALTAAGDYVQQDDGFAAVVERLDVALGSTRAVASGRLGESLDLRWRVRSDDLSELLPEAGGRVRGAGTASGRMPALRVDGTLQGRDLALAGITVREFGVSAELDLSGRQPSTVELTATAGTIGEMAVRRVDLRGAGVPAEHRLELTLEADDAAANASLIGRFEEPWQETRLWRFELDAGRLAYGQFPAWQLMDRAMGQVGPERVQVDRHCWRAEQADLCLQAATGPADGLAASAELSGLGAAQFGPLLDDDMAIEGTLSGSMTLARAPGGPVTAQVDLATTAGRLVLPVLADADRVAGPGPPVVVFEPSRLGLTLEPDEFRVAAAVNLQHGRLRFDAATRAAVVVDGGMTPEARAAQPVRGELEVAVPDLAFVDRLLPAVARTEGAIAGRLELGGTLGEPVSSGRLALRDGAATVVEPRIRVSDVTVILEGRERAGFAFEAVATSGPGQVTASGLLQLLADAPVAQIDVAGENFQIMNTDDARIFASPTLRVEAGRDRVAVSGVVAVPRAEITPGARTAGAVTVSRDQVLVDEETAVDVTPREFYAEIRLIPGDQVYFSGFGLDARIEGDLRLVEEPGLPVTATGELRIVDGEYAAYGQQLEITRGRLFFAGPVTEPALDIEAVRRPRSGILVGARVEGPLADPQFSVFSEPPMSEQEQLAYLVLGRPLDEAPGGEGSALTQAALALGLRGGDVLAQNIGERLGVDELAIVTDGDDEGAEGDPTQASLVVGTYLSPRLYVSYGVGLFQPGSVLQVQYDISRRWRLVTRSGGEAAGADLLFTLERGD